MSKTKIYAKIAELGVLLKTKKMQLETAEDEQQILTLGYEIYYLEKRYSDLYEQYISGGKSEHTRGG